MSELTSAVREGTFGRAAGEWRGREPAAAHVGTSVGWAVAGLAALALGYLAWRHFGPDLRRYLKMEAM